MNNFRKKIVERGITAIIAVVITGSFFIVTEQSTDSKISNLEEKISNLDKKFTITNSDVINQEDVLIRLMEEKDRINMDELTASPIRNDDGTWGIGWNLKVDNTVTVRG